MDHHQHDDHSAANLPHGAPYPNAFYPPDEDQQPYTGLVYAPGMPPGMAPYHVVPAAPPARQLSNSDLQAYHLRNMSLMANAQQQQPFDGQQVYTTSPRTQHANLMLDASPPPPASPNNMYDPLSPPISGSDTSADGAYHSRNSSTSSSRANSLVHRNPLRYNPTPSPSGSSGRRSRGRSFNDSDDDMGVSLAESIAHTRKEATRRQRIEAEQRRRDELRDGYARLKDVLPVSNQKSSKVSLLERATNHIVQLDKMNTQLQKRLNAVESEVQRLRSLNEKISLGSGSTPSPGMSMGLDSRPLSPPPEDGRLSHSLASVSGQDLPREDSSPSPSDDDY